LTIFNISANFPGKFTHLKETGMSFKEYDSHASFFDLEVKQSFGNSRTQKFLSEVMDAINWKPVSTILIENYPVGKSEFGNKAYHPLMLMKALLLQKWFGIKSDPELENQINDRLSFKAFIGLPFSEPSPDHSIICRFRERIGRVGLEKIFHELLEQFNRLGFSIESGLAVGARIIRSASRPVSNKKLNELREKREKTKKKTRFQRDLESDWTVKNKKPFFGMKEHASIDVESGLVLSTSVSKASDNDTNYFSSLLPTAFMGRSFLQTFMPTKDTAAKPIGTF